ncbi:MAG: GAF domain-containing protein [Anaerolineae bacterium]|nr:GAF domain-containing protein [Anaerolineae bacterium]MDQ7036925.1 GAF domain-containing protein [Anaerolineae bacterium]
MNRKIFSLPLQAKILIAIVFAVMLPLLTLGWLGYRGVQQFSRENIESYIAESGTRRQQAIESDFRNAFNIANNFLNSADNLETVTNPIVVLERRGASSESLEMENRAEDILTARLISTGFFNSAWLLNLREVTMATAIDPSISLIETRTIQDQSNRILQAGRQLRERGDSLQGLLVLDVGQNQHVILLNPLFAEVEVGDTELVGYLILDLNLNTIIVDNLAEEVGQLETYAYIILPDGASFLTTEDTLRRNLVNTNSVGASLSKSDISSGVETYTVGSGETRREVIGYHSPININNTRFSLVAEINADIVGEQLQTTFTTFAFPLILGTAILIFLVLLFTTQLINPSLSRLRLAMQGVMRGNYDIPVRDEGRHDEIGELVHTFNDMRDQIRVLTEEMDSRLRARIRDVRVTQDISRAVTAERDLRQLMNQVVDLIVANFPSIYHAQIFLLDSAKEYAVLRASTGKIGEGLLQRGHKLAVGSVSVIGQVTEQSKIIIARDISESDVHRGNEFLHETRAELAIPLQLSGTLIGALDVQSKFRDSFAEDQVIALQTLADQITIAIENVRLYEESARLLSDLERDRRATTRYAWQQYMNSNRVTGLSIAAGTETDYEFSVIKQGVYISGKSIVGERTERGTIPFVVPINLRNETLGVVEYEVPETDFTYDKVLLAEELVSRLAVSLDNARLFQDSQQTADRERIVNEISARLTAQTDIESIIHTAIQEVGQALRTPQVAVRLHKSRPQNGSNGSNNGQAPDADNPSLADN